MCDRKQVQDGDIEEPEHTLSHKHTKSSFKHKTIYFYEELRPE